MGAGLIVEAIVKQKGIKLRRQRQKSPRVTRTHSPLTLARSQKWGSCLMVENVIFSLLPVKDCSLGPCFAQAHCDGMIRPSLQDKSLKFLCQHLPKGSFLCRRNSKKNIHRICPGRPSPPPLWNCSPQQASFVARRRGIGRAGRGPTKPRQEHEITTKMV